MMLMVMGAVLEGHATCIKDALPEAEPCATGLDAVLPRVTARRTLEGRVHATRSKEALTLAATSAASPEWQGGCPPPPPPPKLGTRA